MKSAAADFDTTRRALRECQATAPHQMASTDKCNADRRALEGTNGCLDRLKMPSRAPTRRAASPRSGGAPRHAPSVCGKESAETTADDEGHGPRTAAARAETTADDEGHGPRKAAARTERQPVKMVEPARRAASPRRGAARPSSTCCMVTGLALAKHATQYP